MTLWERGDCHTRLPFIRAYAAIFCPAGTFWSHGHALGRREIHILSCHSIGYNQNCKSVGYSLAITVVFDQRNETSSFLQDLRRPRKPINRLVKLGGLNNLCIITKLSGVEKRTWGFAAGISLCHKRQLLTPSTSLEVHVKTIIGCGEREAKVVVGAVVTNVVLFLVSSLKTGFCRYVGKEATIYKLH